jgi:hypothetical protein
LFLFLGFVPRQPTDLAAQDWETQNQAAKEKRRTVRCCVVLCERGVVCDMRRQPRAALQDNQSAEDEFVRLRDETTAGSEWARVGRLVDLAGVRKSKKDTGRLRSILTQVLARQLALVYPSPTHSGVGFGFVCS